MIIDEIENLKRNQLFKLCQDKREEGVNVFDAQDIVKTSSFYRRIGDLKDRGHRFKVTKKKLKDPGTGNERSYQHYHLINDEPDQMYAIERESERKKSQRFNKLKTQLDSYEGKKAKGQAATCPVCQCKSSAKASTEEKLHVK